eukprot:CAMPEP_0184740690 /NCGR_PEP_ID=MMETSP0315-20130426/3704_1 /TAXON_ID=101924 /ORGANISM="Rhodosorus marinus, Strain UTEX LB 2760" /LENGTH=75 /DNA_ID=CAMNT_0027210517 /DNA_START=1152 /DNA_END=1379 /DNA_ORIENTATION=-
MALVRHAWMDSMIACTRDTGFGLTWFEVEMRSKQPLSSTWSSHAGETVQVILRIAIASALSSVVLNMVDGAIQPI